MLKKILIEYKYSLILIYIFILIAQLLFLAEPYILGKTIDNLLINNYSWLFIFFVIEIIATIFWYKRMVFDTKVYTRMYNKLIFEYLDNDKSDDTSAKLARTDLANNIIHFLEWDMHYYIMSIISLVGSLCFIYIKDLFTGLVVSFAIIPVLFVVLKFYKKIQQGTKVSHNHYEEKMHTMQTKDNNLIKSFFKRRARILVAQSTVQGKNWALLNLIKIIFLILALVVFTSNNVNFSQGDAISMYSYINQFLISLMSIPVGMETFTRIKDILSRIN